MTPQLPLTLRAPPDQRFEAFVGADAIRDAVQAAARGAAGDWLFLEGPPGSGKTHLLLAACADAAAGGRKAAYLPLAGFAGHLSALLPAQEGADLLCLDGVEAIAGHADDEEALFHFHNRARATGATLLYAASAGPGALAIALPDLRTTNRRGATCSARAPRAAASNSTTRCSTTCCAASTATSAR